MQWHMSRVDLPSVIETAVESTYALTVQKDLTVEISPCEDLPAAVADPDRLVQVITNLLSNAVKFTPSGGFIRVQTQLAHHPNPKTGGEMVEISVSDNGIGKRVRQNIRPFSAGQHNAFRQTTRDRAWATDQQGDSGTLRRGNLGRKRTGGGEYFPLYGPGLAVCGPDIWRFGKLGRRGGSRSKLGALAAAPDQIGSALRDKKTSGGRLPLP